MGKLRHKVIAVIAIFIAITFQSNIVLAIKNINFKKITIEDGLSQASIEYLFQDSRGYMWIGTSDGLNRYNGHEIEIYRYSEDRENSITSNYIAAINEDKYGNIWVGTANGLNKISTKTNEIIGYIPKKNGCNLSHHNITQIFIDSKGDIYIGTENGLNVYNKENDNFERILYSEDEKETLTSQFVYSIEEDINGNLWVGTDNGLNKIDRDTGEITKIYAGENSISSNFIYSLYTDYQGYLWVCTFGGGLNKINLKNNEVEVFKNNPEDKTSIPGDFVRNITRDQKGNVWVATDNGFSKLNEGDNTFTTYESKIYDPQSIIDNNILSLVEDNSGTIWVGTYSGISLFNPNNFFNHFKHNPFNKNSLSSNSLAGIYEDNEGLLWIGTVDKGVNILEEESGNVIRLDSNDGLSDNNIKKIVGIDNEIWIATENGLSKVDKKTKEITNYKVEDGEGLIYNDVRTLFIDNEGELWIGTRNGICSFNRKDKFTDYTPLLREQGISENIFSDIFQDKDGDIWIGSGLEGGLIKYNKKTKEIKNYKNNPEDSESLSFNSVRSINEDSKGNLWVATQYGVNKFNKETEKFTRYTEKDGLSNNFVYGILIDDKDDIWLSSNYGISKFDVENEKFVNFNVTDGLQGNEFNGYSYFKSKSGEMFFGGINGLTSFLPADLNETTYIPKIEIESILSEGEALCLFKELNLTYKQDQLQITFFMPDYRNTSKIQYAYRLIGVDNEWVFSENRNYANYTNLNPGSYIFEVKGRNSSGEWSEPKKIDIRISNPPWKTPIAYLVYFLIFITILYIIWNRVKILDGLVKQRTYELDNKLKENEELYYKLIKNEKYKNNYFVNLSHELRTPLNVILSTQQLITNLNESEDNIPKEKISYYMETLKRNSNRLLKLINNIIDTSKIESGSYKLDISEIDIVYLVEEVALSMKDYIESNGIEFIIDPEIEEKIIECDSGEIEKCIVNLIANAVKFTPYGGIIEIKLFDRDDKVEISIRDTGIGIEEKYREAIFNRFGQAYNNISEEHGGSGLGLTLTKQLVKLHSGEIKLKTEVGEGSEFIIVLPVRQNR
ncbi:ligand-binding sensor domain-containing protein [Clostridium sp.]|uniref:ligand-binding sensor domain-containing protein n=1 Tax=Clostridium sp. TaxID=1506 RepID=UPI003F2CFC79